RLLVQGPWGRSPIRWTDQNRAGVNVPILQCTKKTATRMEWRYLVKWVTDP
ncbi:hypothetical protein RR46_13698, partial [Papilio xuthus]